MDWITVPLLIALILLIFSFRCSVPFLDRICRIGIIGRFPSVGIPDKDAERNAENHLFRKREGAAG